MIFVLVQSVRYFRLSRHRTIFNCTFHLLTAGTRLPTTSLSLILKYECPASKWAIIGPTASTLLAPCAQFLAVTEPHIKGRRGDGPNPSLVAWPPFNTTGLIITPSLLAAHTLSSSSRELANTLHPHLSPPHTHSDSCIGSTFKMVTRSKEMDAGDRERPVCPKIYKYTKPSVG